LDGRAKNLLIYLKYISSMTGKRRLLVVGMVVVVVLGLTFLAFGMAMQRTPLDVYESLSFGGEYYDDQSGAGTSALDADEVGGIVDLPDFLLNELRAEQDPDGSWEGDVNATAISGYAFDYHTDASAGVSVTNETYRTSANSADNWTIDNFIYSEATAPGEVAPFIVISDVDVGFKDSVVNDLVADQSPDGSWNNDVSDTALATFALASYNGPAYPPVQGGIEWLLAHEVDNSWGSIGVDAKAILALDIGNNDMTDELEILIANQEADGSFGTVEDSAWALMAMSVDLDINTLEQADKAILWLRAQDIDDERELALAALGEQYYNSAVIGSNVLNEGLGPPFWLYPVIIIIIAAFITQALLFARLGSEDVMDGVRKDIYDYIAEHPGEHLAEITRQFEMSSSSTRHHLTVLEFNDKIVSHKQGKHRHYYLNMNGYRRYTNGFEYKRIMSTLKNPTTREMVKYLAEHKNSNQKSISEALNVHPSTVNWHAKRLKDAKIIAQTRSGKDILYTLNNEIELDQVITLIEGASS
jgi:predicted transcriptional regulator